MKKFPVIALVGPRQSGKSTFALTHFPGYRYINFEDPGVRNFAREDPHGFFSTYENEQGLILDEFQHVPELLSYIQLIVDTKKRPGYFVLTGSPHFLMNRALTQSLAGRVGIYTLLPLSLHELTENELRANDPYEQIFKGGYPRLYAESFSPIDFYPPYIHTYIERDVRMLMNIGDLRAFHTFVTLCAGRIGQLLNLSDLAVSAGISVPTASAWISVLEASFIVFLLQPHFNNFNKRLVKTPKLYFYDTGVACSLLGMDSAKTLAVSPFRGPLFENLIIGDLYKQLLLSTNRTPLYFWRDTNDRLEIDAVIDKASHLTAIEIKSGKTLDNSFFDALKRWQALSSTTANDAYLVYAGDENQKRTVAEVISWTHSADIVKNLFDGD